MKRLILFTLLALALWVGAIWSLQALPTQNPPDIPGAVYADGASDAFWNQTSRDETPTPIPFPSPGCYELLTNGDFESGALSPWDGSGAIGLGSGRNSAYGARLGGDNNVEGKLWQEVSIPANVNPVQLTFWWIAEGEKMRINGTTVDVIVKHNGQADLLLTLSARASAGQWRQETLDMAAYAGSDAAIIFQVRTDPEIPTVVRLDDISLKACETATPTPTPETLCALEDVSPGPGSTPQGPPYASLWGKMLSLSVTGVEGVSGPATSWTTQDGGKLVEHLAAADQDGQLILYYMTPDHDWMTVNISEKTGASIAIERPESWIFTDTSYVLERLAAPAVNGDLMLFTWHSGSDWQATNLSSATGEKIVGPVTSWDTTLDGSHVEHIAARAINDDLLVFSRKAGGQWTVANVTDITGQKVGDAPIGWAYQTGNAWGEYLAAPAPNGDMMYFSLFPSATWQVDNLTQRTGQKVNGSATVWISQTGGHAMHLAAPAPNDALVVFTYDPVESVWHVENLTTITGQKVGGSATSWQVQDGSVEWEHLAAPGLNGHLYVFSRSTGQTWTAVDVTDITGRTITHTPTSWTVPQDGGVVQKLAAPSGDGRLYIFTREPDANWQSADVSLKAAGRTVYAASEKAGVWFSKDYGRFWTQSTRPQPAQSAQTVGGLDSPNVLDVAVSPADPHLVLAATDSDHRNPSLAGIYRSTDGGSTWTRVHTFTCNGDVQPATQVIFAPDDPTTLYAAGGCAIAISTDSGLTWHEVAPPEIETGARVWHVAVSPLLGGQRNAFACGWGNLWFSPDSGQTWRRDEGAAQALPGGFCGRTTNGNGDAAQTLAVEPGKPDHIYLAYQNNANGPGYFQPPIYGLDGIHCNNPVVYDNNDDGRYNSGEEIIRGFHVNQNASLQSESNIKFVDANGNGRFDSGESVVYDANSNDIYDTDNQNNKEAVLGGSSPQVGDSLKWDSKVRYVDLGTPFGPRGCGEGSLWYGDLSGFDPGQDTLKGDWSQLPGPPVYSGRSTASGAAFVFTHPKGGEDYLVFFADQDTLHVSVGKPTKGSWHRLDGWDASKNKREQKLYDVSPVHVDSHGLAFSPDFNLTLRRPDVESPYDMNMELDQCLGGRLWYANDGGVYRSDDCGETWLPTEAGLSTLAAINVAGVARPGAAPALYFGAGDNDDFYSLDGGAIWRSGVDVCGDCGVWYADPAQPNRVVGLSRTIPVFGLYENPAGPGSYPDAGDHAQLYKPPTPTTPTGAESRLFEHPGYRPMIQTLANETPVPDGDYILIQEIQPSDGSPVRRVLLRAKNSIHNPTPWTQEGPDLPSSATVVQAAGGHASPTYYVGDYEKLWKSHRDAHGNIDDWRQIVPGNGATKAYRFFVNPYDADDVYIVDVDAVRHSTDGGATWPIDAQLDAALTAGGEFTHDCPTSWIYITFHDCILNEMAFDRQAPQTRFAAGLAGVFYSGDASNWFRLVDTKALPSRPIGLYFDPITDSNDHSLYIAFLGRSIMRCQPIPSQPPTPEPIPTPTPGPSPTPTPTPPPPGRPLLGNGSFETGKLAPWEAFGDAQVVDEYAHTGRFSALMGTQTDGIGRLTQTVTIPDDAEQAIFSYWWRVDSDDAQPQADTMDVLVQWEDGAATLETLSNSSPLWQWRQSWFDLSDFRGQKVTLTFRSAENSKEPTLFYLDDIRLDVPQGQLYLPLILNNGR